jgi:hypothetical protein
MYSFNVKKQHDVHPFLPSISTEEQVKQSDDLSNFYREETPPDSHLPTLTGSPTVITM